MEIAGKTIVLTGAATGVGEAAARRFAADGANVVLTDIDVAGLAKVAADIGATSMPGDIGQEDTVQALAALARREHGQIDIWFSNAGLNGKGNRIALENNLDWQRTWNVHVMAHVYAARAVLPEMLARGEGYLLHTASAVALSLQVDKANYSVTKHAALGLSEWLAANFRPKGVRVSCFCPGAMNTGMLHRSGLAPDHPAIQAALSMDAVADILVRGIAEEKFLIAHDGPTTQVPEYLTKGQDYEAWLGTMSEMALHWPVPE